MEKLKIDRINVLARKARECELSAEEVSERQVLRSEYVAACKASLKAQLGCLHMVDEEGNIKKLGE